MQDILIKSDSTIIGKLVLIDYLPVEGVPLKADNYYVTYALIINETQIAGVFSDKFVCNEQVLFITELFIETTPEGFGIFLGSALNQICLETGEIKKLSSLQKGYIYPVSIENNKIIYTKTQIGSSVTHEFEQAISV